MKPRINTVLIPSANYENLNELVTGQMTNQKRMPGAANRMVKRKAIPAYIAIFADLMTLLLCFFVLLLSMSELDVVRLKMVAQSMHNAFGVEQPEEPDPIPKGTSIVQQTFSPNPSDMTVIQQVQQDADPNNPTLDTADLNLYMQAKQQRQLMEIKEALKEQIDEGLLQVETREDRVVITIDEQASFPSGLASIKPAFVPVLKTIADALANIEDPLVVSGHTDDRPLNTSQYRSNWELSGSRATSVVHELLRYPEYQAERFRVEGYADTRPLTENDTESGRARNRRVEIAVLTQ
ncbi:flagellar motor protein MotB [Methylophaga nitratireducenticrescens]|uniref:Flagellar motor rotation protein MotB n=1 Tax=Methylophaga nitratireducenticrescens TaxID=754476 RepID=I1XFV2_METNJ|nr:OmpA family protein [Methylophaga nitratireducenticrescens]AFI83271.1 flagellar motor protein MotB [Methylophaga nitratireducenticrescens]AUZ83400.1 flagellar motor protein MotB [Methylophaga nitratireducenticrescens]